MSTLATTRCRKRMMRSDYANSESEFAMASGPVGGVARKFGLEARVQSTIRALVKDQEVFVMDVRRLSKCGTRAGSRLEPKFSPKCQEFCNGPIFFAQNSAAGPVYCKFLLLPQFYAGFPSKWSRFQAKSAPLNHSSEIFLSPTRSMSGFAPGHRTLDLDFVRILTRPGGQNPGNLSGFASGIWAYFHWSSVGKLLTVGAIEEIFASSSVALWARLEADRSQ
ncbi:hypothetical protein B0H16DRAFT_1453590 [Mycena metata]|uniref:Uncharacterized protein n=1 Tax=Mycena metata TaxID=1033252 RepID=A0AAD7NN63_9AGAR|nr:hypothetical protein B0H16DRAFT_1453590 [Mycena metata]